MARLVRQLSHRSPGAPPLTRSPRLRLLATLVAATIGLGCTAGAADRQEAGPQPQPPSAREIQRGVSWVAGPVPVTAAQIGRLPELGVTHIVQTPFGWQSAFDSPSITVKTTGVLWGETDRGLEVTTRLAQEAGIATLLKPHIWLPLRKGKWRSEIEMSNEDDWQSWFASYRAFILHYAALAERLGIEGLSIGTELRMTVVERPDDWRRLIREVREVYSGELTYAANWWKEFEEVPFWDELDFIGIQGYFPLTDKNHPSDAELDAGWLPHLSAIEAVQTRFGKPVVFTEIGYRSSPDAAIEPWEWPDESITDPARISPAVQAQCYEAFFRTLWDRPWFAGAYFWKWFPPHEHVGGPGHIGFTPQNKPAEEVMARWYRGAAPPESPPR